MNNEKRTTVSNLQTTQSNIVPIRAESFKIIPRPENYDQFGNAIKACLAAGLPLRFIANAGAFLNEKVYRETHDVNLQQGLQGKIGEVVENESTIIAWQSRGEKITVMRELPAVEEPGSKIVPISNGLTNSANQPKTIDVLEGIAVVKEQPTQIAGNNTDYLELTYNPYLKADAGFKKTA